jgi:hypothetical protein
LNRSATPFVSGSATKAKLGNSPEPDLVLEVIRGVLRAAIHAQGETPTDIGACGAEFSLDSLSDRFERSEAVTRFGCVDADAAGVEAIDGREHPDPTFLYGLDANAVGAPQEVGSIRGDRPVMQNRHAPRPTMRREQRMLAHRAQCAGARDTDASQKTQSRPHLACSSPVKGEVGRSARIAARRSASDTLGFGPRRSG